MTNADTPFTMTERLIRAIARQVNTRPALKRVSHAFIRSAGATGVRWATRELVHVTNAEALDGLPRDRGVIVASNHRSLCDMYVVSSVLLRRVGWIERLYFPVRTENIYDRWGGLFLNALLSGISMYPPIYRDASRRRLNRASVDFLVEALGKPGTVIGLHPEGRRSFGTDPYTLLPAQPGIGEIVQRARPVVLPVFILGLETDFVKQVRATLNGTAAPITITFGRPVALDACPAGAAGPRSWLRVAQAIRSDIEALGAIDRRVRAGLS
ncbi:MAG: lysophospholipid acyltransferase family protein [Vicinamibacterales bacterium]